MGISRPVSALAGLVLAAACAASPNLYRVDGETLDLRSGEARIPIPGLEGASARTLYRLAAEDTGDLDGNGVADRAAVVSVDSGGSGTFHHVTASLGHSDGARPLGSLLLGDRVEIRDLRILAPGHVDAGMIVVGVGIRAPDQALAEPPRFYVTRMFVVRDGELVEIPQY